MAFVADRFCIDRYEATMVDAVSGQEFSPFYPPSLEEMKRAVVGQEWGNAAVGKAKLNPPVPLLPEWQRTANAKARAVSRPGVVPQGYVSKRTAEGACSEAGKRLCKLEEWKVACRGEQGTLFPYGPKYRAGACNVHGPAHPAAILHGDASIGHWDPRLNQVTFGGATLLRPTGATPECRSVWGADAIYDMVGNLDEWVEDGKGTFAGGFYARDTTRGCDARITEHGAAYFDYSTGVRCCSDPKP
jgi:formylglycine-generating enzyme required for sulfatase activity